jgi:hypothetical protein
MKFRFAYYVSALLVTLSGSLFAQSTDNKSPYVFPEFVKGSVSQKGGGVAEAVLNYNVITQEMMFDQNGSRLVLDQADNIDTLYIANRKFIPARSVYFEKLTNTSIPLFVQFKGKAVPVGSSKPGGESNTVGGMNGTKKSDDAQKLTSYNLQLPDNYVLKASNEYWVQKEGAFYPANNLKKLVKLFSGKEAAIEAYIKENNLRIDNQADMIKLVVFANK